VGSNPIASTFYGFTFGGVSTSRFSCVEGCNAGATSPRDRWLTSSRLRHVWAFAHP
jgi:hypothetical protein